MSTHERVIRIIRQAAGLQSDEPIGADTGLVGSGLWLDSVAVLELLVALEKEFGIELDRSTLSQAGALSTVGSLTDLVNSLIHGEH
jgi:acyl carrier protein